MAGCRRRTARATSPRISPASVASSRTSRPAARSTTSPVPADLPEREGGLSELRHAGPRHPGRQLDHLRQGSNGLFPGATNVQPAGYNSLLTNSASVKDMYQRIGVSGDATFYANFAGQHTFKGGVQFERIRNDVFSAEQAPHITLQLERLADARSTARVVRGDVRLLLVASVRHDRRRPRQQPRPLLPGRLDGQQQADAEPRRPHREGGRPVVCRRAERLQVRLRRQVRAARSASPTTSRATASGRRSAAAACSTT